MDISQNMFYLTRLWDDFFVASIIFQIIRNKHRAMERPATSHSQKINEQIRKELLPRTDKLKQMISLNMVPESCQAKIIIPCLQKTLGFKTNQYNINKHFLEEYVKKADFNSFVRKCNKIVEQEVIRKTKKQNEPFFGIISTLLRISIVIAVLTFILLASVVFIQLNDDITTIILIIAGVFLASASMIAAICPVVLFTSKYESLNYQQSIKSRLQILTQFQNDNLIHKGKKHLRWQVQTNFFWIQLNINQKLYDEEIDSKPSNMQEEYSQEVSANDFVRNKSKGYYANNMNMSKHQDYM